MRKGNVALRLQTSILDEARRVSETEGLALNQFNNVAVAEKLSALRTEDYLRERGARGDVAKAKRFLKRAGRGNARPPATNWIESKTANLTLTPAHGFPSGT